MAAKTLAEHQVEALTGALRWADGEIEKLRVVLADVEAEIENHSSCMSGESCSIKDDINEIIEKWKSR